MFFLCFGICAFVICFKQAILKRLVNALAAMCGLVVPIALAHAGCIVLCVFTVCRDTCLIMVDHGVEIVAGIVPILHGVDGRGAAISSQVAEMSKIVQPVAPAGASRGARRAIGDAFCST